MESELAPNAAITHRRRFDRSVDELIGICRGILADGLVVQQEAEFLLSWIEGNKEFVSYYPYNALYPRLADMLSDGVLDEEEEGELLKMLLDFQGGAGDPSKGFGASALPLCDPPPDVLFRDKVFVITGLFAAGTRKEVTTEILLRYGQVKSSPSKKTDYLVVGVAGNDDWQHTSYGRKIEKAIALRDQGAKISIVSESHWLKCLDVHHD